MNLETHIRQQRSTVQMLEKLLKAKRCSLAEVDQAKQRLADLQQQTVFVPMVPRPERVVTPPVPEPVATGRPIVGDEFASVQADLSSQANRLNHQMAELSNQLHKIPASVSCPELTSQILELKAQIELIWDKKYYLERNHCLPDEPTEQADAPVTLSDASQYQLAYEKRRLIDLRSKLRRKLLNPKAKPGKVHEWETELAQCTLKIQEIEFKLV